MTIYVDMDGTIADFYGVEGWLDDLENYRSRPYAEAKPLFNFSAFAKQIHRLQKIGVSVGIISWLSKCGTEEFNEEVTEVKIAWLRKHLPSVQFDELHIVAYGTPKQNFSKNENDILFDDEEKNRETWTGTAYDVQNILEILRTIKGE